MYPDVGHRSDDVGRVTLFTRDPAELVRALVHADANLDGLEVVPVTLEQALLALSERAA